MLRKYLKKEISKSFMMKVEIRNGRILLDKNQCLPKPSHLFIFHLFTLCAHVHTCPCTTTKLGHQARQPMLLPTVPSHWPLSVKMDIFGWIFFHQDGGTLRKPTLIWHNCKSSSHCKGDKEINDMYCKEEIKACIIRLYNLYGLSKGIYIGNSLNKLSSIRPQAQDQPTKITCNSPKDEHLVVEVKTKLLFIITQRKKKNT